jgi:hypothetical protein
VRVDGSTSFAVAWNQAFSARTTMAARGFG